MASQKNEQALTKKIQQKVAELEAVVEASIESETDREQADRSVRNAEAMLQAMMASVRGRLRELEEDQMPPVLFDQIPQLRIKELRVVTGRTQAALASEMENIGFDWKRLTVSDIESQRRAVSLNEIAGLAKILGVPMTDLLTSHDRLVFVGSEIAWLGMEDEDAVAVALSPAEARELLLGDGSRSGAA